MGKRLENAFNLLSNYEGEEYRRLNGTRKFSLLVLEYGTGKAGITLLGTRHIHRNRGNASKIKRSVTSLVLDYFKRTPKSKRLVMVEGFADGQPVCADTKEKSFDMGEPAGVVFLAKRTGTGVISPEPSMPEQMRYLLSLGFSREEAMLHYIVRQVPGDIEAEALNSRGISYIGRIAIVAGDMKAEKLGNEYVINHVIPRLNRMMRKLKGKNLFRKKEGLIVSDFSPDQLYPLTNPTLKLTKINKIAYNVSDIRDRSIISRIESSVKSGKSPLVVYGRSHIARIKPALDYLYGKPVKIKV